jgi:hypothetical protein
VNFGSEALHTTEVQVGFALVHLLMLWMMAYLLLGMARTAVSVCMYRLDRQGLWFGLFQGDIWPGKFWRNVRMAKVVRITLMATFFLLMSLWMAATLWFMPQFANYWWLRGTDGGFFSRPVVATAHLLAMAEVFVYAIRRGLRGAVTVMPENPM